MKINLSKDQLKAICSMGLYWEEVSKRENPRQILRNELSYVTQEIGVDNILAIINNYAKEKAEGQ